MGQLRILTAAIVATLSLPLAAQPPGSGSKLVGAGAVGNAKQGTAVAIAADGTIIIGGPPDNNGLGAAWIFNQEQPVAKLTATDASGAAAQGTSVAISADGNTAVVGAPGDSGGAGATWVFARIEGVWTQQAKLVGSGAVGNSRQGIVSISADGNTVAIGGPEDNRFAGALWVFTRTGGIWTQQGSKLTGSNGGFRPLLGGSVALSADGNTAIAGSAMEVLEGRNGAAWIFTRADGVWTQQGPKLLGSPQFENSGASVAISADGNTALVGQVSFAGGALAYTRSDGVWTQQGPQLSVATSDGESYSVYAVALSGDGNTALIGTTAYAGNWPGAAWIFARTGGQWLQAGGKLLSSGAIGSLTRQGSSVALSPGGEYGLVGDPGDNDGAGAAWLFAISRKPVPSLSVSSSAKLATYAAQPTFMVRVVGDASSGAPTGTVSILVDDFVQSQAAALLDGAASLTASIPPGDHSVRFAYSGDAIYSAITSAALAQTINHGPTSTTLTATPSYTAGLLRLSSHVNGPDAAARINDGATTFRDAAGKVLGSPVTLGGDAHWDVSLASLTTPAAIYRFTASYDGSSDANRTYDPSPLSIPATFTTGGNTVTVRLTSSANPAVFGEPVTITATVVPPAGRPMPTGTVGFFDNSTRYSSLATGGALAPLNKSGQASMTAPFDAGLSNRTIVLLGGGTHVISATYFGDANYSATPFAQDGPAATVNQQIARADTTTALRTGYGPDGRSSFIAGVSPIAEFPSARAVLDPDGKLLNGYPAGAVQFWKDNTLIGAASIHQASVPSFASLSASTPLGNIRAVYTGDSNYNGSSDPAPLSPPPSPRTVILTADPISPTTLQPVTFTATVEAVSGTVQFFDGRAPLGTAPVVRGQARFTTFLRAGAHSIGAAYNGNPDYPAPSATIGMYVTQPRP